MRNLKKILLTGSLTLATLIAISSKANAATVKVTGEVVNIRKTASTEADVVARLSENVECEYLGQEGNWYKVKYNNYTGYVSKEYAKLEGEVSTNTQPSNQEINSQTNNQTSNQNTEQNNTQTNNQTNNEQTENNTNNENTTTNNTQDNNNETDENSQNETTELVYKKFNQNTTIRILPLVHSSNIGQVKKNKEVLILAETTGWSYVQTDEISGWVRTDTLGEAKTVTTGGSSTSSKSTQDDKTTQASTSTVNEKVGYISEEEVNMRKGAGTTYDVVKVLKLNAQVTILGESGSWYKVKFGTDTGYISKTYVSSSKTVTNRSLSEPREEKDDTDKSDDTVDTSKNNETTNNTNTTKNNENATTNSETSNKTESSTNTTKQTSSNTATSTNNTTNATTQSTSKGSDVVAYAKKFLGYRYVWGGDGSNGTFDCSGFTMYVYKHFGVSLPHYTVSQYNSGKGKKITKQSDLKMGDIVYLTDYVSGASCGHCGIYIENGKFIHADSTVMKVNISDLNGMYKGRFCGALRIF